MASSQRVLIMRHPETVANVQHFMSGREDVDLTPAGERQMRRAIKAVVAWKPDRIWCSPLSRCRSIAEEAAFELGLECEVHDAFEEIDFGPLGGMPMAKARELGWTFPWAQGPDGRTLCPEGAESFEALLARAHRALDELRPLEGRTAVISHGGFSRALIAAVIGGTIPDFWNLVLPNVCSQVLACEDGTFSVAAIGLAPEEVERRMAEPMLIGRDTVAEASATDHEGGAR